MFRRTPLGSIDPAYVAADLDREAYTGLGGLGGEGDTEECGENS